MLRPMAGATARHLVVIQIRAGAVPIAVAAVAVGIPPLLQGAAVVVVVAIHFAMHIAKQMALLLVGAEAMNATSVQPVTKTREFVNQQKRLVTARKGISAENVIPAVTARARSRAIVIPRLVLHRHHLLNHLPSVKVLLCVILKGEARAALKTTRPWVRSRLAMVNA